MKTITAVLALLTLAACGSHYFVNLTDATARRESDGVVVVTATMQCEAVGTEPNCSSVGQYCVRAVWRPSLSKPDTSAGDAGVPPDAIDSVTGCSNRVLKDGETTTIELRSTKPIPTTSQVGISFTVDHGVEIFDQVLISPTGQ